MRPVFTEAGGVGVIEAVSIPPDEQPAAARQVETTKKTAETRMTTRTQHTVFGQWAPTTQIQGNC